MLKEMVMCVVIFQGIVVRLLTKDGTKHIVSPFVHSHIRTSKKIQV